MVLFNECRVKRLEIPDYFNEYYYSAIHVYNRCKRRGAPFSGGWTEWPEYVVRLLDLFDETMEGYSTHMAEKAKRKQHGSSGGATSNNRR